MVQLPLKSSSKHTDFAESQANARQKTPPNIPATLAKASCTKKTMQFYCDHSAAESAHLAFLCIFCKLAGRASKVFLDFLMGSTPEILSEQL